MAAKYAGKATGNLVALANFVCLAFDFTTVAVVYDAIVIESALPLLRQSQGTWGLASE